MTNSNENHYLIQLMKNQQSHKEFSYLFRGNLNSPIVTSSLILIIPLFAILLGISLSFSVVGKILGLSITFSLLIYFFIKFDSESNLILFTPDEIVHYTKKSLDKFSYADVNKVEIIKPSKSPIFITLKIRRNEFTFYLEKKNYANFTYDEFAEYLLKINNDILILNSINDKFKYSLLNGEVIKTQL